MCHVSFFRIVYHNSRHQCGHKLAFDDIIGPIYEKSKKAYKDLIEYKYIYTMIFIMN